MAPRRMFRTVALLLVIALTGACGSDGDERRADRPDGSTTPTTPTTPSTPAEPDLPDTPVGDALGWYVEVLNGTDVDEATYTERFAEPFRDQVPYTDFTGVLGQLRSTAPGGWRLVSIEPADADLEAEAVLGSDVMALAVQIAVEAEEPHRIDGLVAAPKGADVESLEDVRDEIDAIAPTSGMLVAEVVDDSCEPLTRLREDERVPVGSAFKLWVLGAVAEDVAAGRLRWDQPVTIRDELDSLPTGVTQDDPAGSTVPVETLALRMISISDNTATDHLIHLVGRERVEDAMARFGHDDPSVNVPLLTTKDLFVLKLGLDDDQRAAYLESGPDERRAFLETEAAGRPVAELDVSGYTAPIAADTVEWFASPTELCRAMVILDGMARRPGGEAIRRILGAEPAVEPDPAFAYVGFKGGSEIGVQAVAWLVERTDGRRFAFTAAVLDTEAEIAPSFLPTVAAGVGFLADI